MADGELADNNNKDKEAATINLHTRADVERLCALVNVESLTVGYSLLAGDFLRVFVQVVAEKLTSLRSLKIDYCAFSHEDLATLLKAVECNANIDFLDIHDNNKFGDAHALVLAEFLAANRTLKAISLESNPIGDEAAMKLAASLAINTTLIDFRWFCRSDLERNYIGKLLRDRGGSFEIEDSITQADSSAMNMATADAEHDEESYFHDKVGKCFVDALKLNSSLQHVAFNGTSERFDITLSTLWLDKSKKNLSVTGGFYSNTAQAFASASTSLSHGPAAVYPRMFDVLAEGAALEDVDLIFLMGIGKPNIIAQSLMNSLLRSSAQSLTSLTLSDLAFDMNDMVASLYALPLKTLRLNRCDITDDAMEVLVDEYINRRPNLAVLDVSSNNLQRRGLELLLASLDKLEMLQELQIDDNTFANDQELDYLIANVILTHRTLREMRPLGPLTKGAVASKRNYGSQALIAETFTRESLQAAFEQVFRVEDSLEIDVMRFYDPDGLGYWDILKQAAWRLSDSSQVTLSKLAIGGSTRPINDDHFKTFFSAVVLNPNIKSFSLTRNNITDKSIEFLIATLRAKGMTSLKVIDLSLNRVTDSGALCLAEFLVASSIDIKVYIDFNDLSLEAVGKIKSLQGTVDESESDASFGIGVAKPGEPSDFKLTLCDDDSEKPFESLTIAVLGFGNDRLNNHFCRSAIGHPYAAEDFTGCHDFGWACLVDGKRIDFELCTTDGWTDGSKGVRQMIEESRKHRRFYYDNLFARTGMFIAIFSFEDLSTLDELENHTIPEVRRLAPKAPIVMVGAHAEYRVKDDRLPSILSLQQKAKALGCISYHEWWIPTMLDVYDIVIQSLRTWVMEYATNATAAENASIHEKKSPSLVLQDIETASIGVQLSHVRSLVERHRAQDMTIGEFCEKVIKPLTNSMSYAQKLLSDPDTRHFVKSPADSFVSYAWKYRTGDVLDALLKNSSSGKPEDDQDRYIWMDVLVVNQHKSSDVDREGWMSTFGNALNAIGRCEMVMIPWYSPVTITRTWCVFEQYEVARRGIHRIPRVTPSDELVAQAFVKSGLSLRAIKHMFSAVQVAASEASDPLDREVILDLVDKAGADIVNNVTMRGIRSWLLSISQQLAEADQATRGVTLSERNLRLFEDIRDWRTLIV